ncbi:isochorismate synthase [Marichromatium bheemlicum]|uniref:isochorismate synthase n=1 Tax=Marichromatium bheemlicum TaxID=365339 RepID=A0ABX1I419_9GAMM|nr:isochorismate synthase [Marichromatium bheemlicum]NKN32255.1 isochorismate synthase [Marichromatium bheemlicum]
MLAPLQRLEQLKARVREAIATPGFGHPHGLVSLALELPQPLHAAPELSGPRFQFAHSHRGELRAGYGIAAEWQAAGEQRLQRLREQARAAATDWHQLDPDETGLGGFAMLGFAATPEPTTTPGASDLPNAVYWIPEVALSTSGEQSALILSTRLPVEPEALLTRWDAWLERLVPLLAQPARAPLTPATLERGPSEPALEPWRDLVLAALDAIERDGPLEKLVLCRRQRLQGHRRFDLDRLNDALAYLFPSCQVINVRHRESCFVAATPERLFTLRGRRVEADAIAGTACRAADAARDAALTAELLGCAKNLHEHQVVVAAVGAALERCCTRLEPVEGPRVMQLNNAQHLWSLVRGEVDAAGDVFSLAELLHPTPATNGQPRRDAHDWLRRNEPFERDWYTGAAGIVEPDLSGELWVLLRCARVAADSAELYAGAGIVPGSDPVSEWEEIDHKFAAIATALQFA